ncbi:MAG: hypothetical protein ACREU8_06815 [Gammaproteobacteria bacterium]
MNIRFLRKTSIVWLAAALPLCAALVSSPAFAVDAVGGAANNGAIAVNAVVNCANPGAWTILETVPFQNPVQRYCIATGSADALLPMTVDGENFYYFTVSDRRNPRCDQGQERTLTFRNQGGILDNRIKEITTTGGWMSQANSDPGYFTVPAGFNRTLYFLARKANAAIPNLTVDDASLTVTCTDNRLVPPLVIDPVLTQ